LSKALLSFIKKALLVNIVAFEYNKEKFTFYGIIVTDVYSANGQDCGI
jgi:hypothetical protein